MTDIKKILASNLKSYRKKRGLSQAQLAEKIGIATPYLAMIETCKSFPSAEMIERLAEGLEQDSLDLFSLYPIQHEWKEILIADIGTFLEQKILNESGTGPRIYK